MSSRLLQQFLKAIGVEPTPAPQFKAIGGGVWIAAFTNNFQDLHGEILSAKSHQRYVARVKAQLTPMPELWHWHKEGSRHGVADVVDLVGDHTVVAVGHFDDTPAGKAAEKHYRSAGPYRLSHGFTYPEWALKNGVYSDYNTFEISTLPPGREANPFTTFQEIETMAGVSDQVKQSINAIFGDQGAEIITAIEGIEAQSAKVRAMGVKFKDFADLVAPMDDATKDRGGDVVSTDFAAIMLKESADSLDVAERTLAVINGVEARVKVMEDKVTASLASFEAARKALDDELKLVPRRVEDAVKAIEDGDAEKELDEQQGDGPKMDPMFPGMSVPLSS